MQPDDAILLPLLVHRQMTETSTKRSLGPCLVRLVIGVVVAVSAKAG